VSGKKELNPVYQQAIQPFRHRPVARPTTQFVGGLIPLTTVISTIQQGNYIAPATAAPAALPVGWLVALGGAYIAYQMAGTRESLAIGVALAMLAGEAVYEILYAIGQGSTATSSSSS
jgi:hypothetical protein